VLNKLHNSNLPLDFLTRRGFARLVVESQVVAATGRSVRRPGDDFDGDALASFDMRAEFDAAFNKMKYIV
jgi:hypothetical protein